MYSIKPGRARSLLAADGGLVFVVTLLLTASAMGQTGVPGAMMLVPVLMALLGLCVIAYHAYNAFAPNRASDIDITTDEPDPLSPARRPRPHAADDARRFCAHCGHAFPENANFCPHCGMPARD
jgi:threonine/homoserine/homoserine lactone efflux protein